ncbi:MAG: helix-turn-helix domain-containing protein [Oscillospiraceae bacterium]
MPETYANGSNGTKHLKQQETDWKDKILRGLVLEKLLLSTKELPEYLDELLKISGIRFISPWFLVIVIRVLKREDIICDQQKTPLEHFQDVYSVITKAFEEALSGFGAVFCVNRWDGIPCIVNFEPDMNLHVKENLMEVVQSVTRAVEQVVQDIREKNGIYLMASISQIIQNRFELERAFEVAYDISLSSLNNSSTVQSFYTSVYLPGEEKYAKVRMEKLINQFYTAMSGFHFMDAAKHLAGLTDIYLRQNAYGFRTLPFFLMQYLQSGLGEIKPSVPSAVRKDIMLGIGRIITEHSKRIPEDWNGAASLTRLIDEIFAWIEQSVSSEGLQFPRQLSEALDYIQKNYMDVSLNINKVCDVMGFQTAAFSRLFKRTFGINPLDYLHLCRISASKKLLGKSERPLYEIAREVGYINAKGLIQAFKRYEGITPGRYRKNI